MYDKKVAREILETAGVLSKRVVIEDAGVFPANALKRPKPKGPDDPVGVEPKERVFLRWRPARVMTKARGAPSTNDTPMLPPEFSGRELAAFMLAGTGALVADFFGDWEDGPDPARLEFLDEDSGAREAVEDAFTAYREAVERVGLPDRALAARMYEAHEAYRKARTDAMGRHCLSAVPQATSGDNEERRHELGAEYQRRLALVEGDVSGLEAEMNSLKEKNDKAEKAWLRAIVAELLKPVTGPAEPDAEPASQAVPVEQQEAIDFGMLATPEKLIDTFGNFTGMCKAWFDNLTDTPRLLAARKVTGTGGKHHTPPLFCPFEVMQWLIDDKRKKGRKVSPEKAWQLLQSSFEKVYNARSAGDPR